MKDDVGLRECSFTGPKKGQNHCVKERIISPFRSGLDDGKQVSNQTNAHPPARANDFPNVSRDAQKARARRAKTSAACPNGRTRSSRRRRRESARSTPILRAGDANPSQRCVRLRMGLLERSKSSGPGRPNNRRSARQKRKDGRPRMLEGFAMCEAYRRILERVQCVRGGLAHTSTQHPRYVHPGSAVHHRHYHSKFGTPLHCCCRTLYCGGGRGLPSRASATTRACGSLTSGCERAPHSF